MAELRNDCCSPDAQASCCEPAEKDACCGEQHGDGCGCSSSASQTSTATGSTAAAEQLRESVREKYATAAKAAATGTHAGVCSPADRAGAFGSSLYDETTEASESALSASLGCGVPTAVADLNEGEVVLDLGSGAGADVLISARRVGPSGHAIGIDMTDEMLELARRNAADAGVENVEFCKGYLEEMPLAGESVDVVISNCVINLAGDKAEVLREAARVLRPGGLFAVSDVIADPDMDEQTRADMAAWTGCIAGALTEVEFSSELRSAGFEDIEIRQTHRVHKSAAAAIVRARKRGRLGGPAPAFGCHRRHVRSSHAH